ncbi:MAG: UvrD-helicase domain-containing protein [Zetaproteobacteria bacterium]|nr:UvrD-helicase domain-containing protein [Zetaproteobacteria bacterium]
MSDQTIRQRVCQPHGSFLVQAPAGSGKTELLTRRILTLLTLVDEPEEILALTFTKKAAAEMRHRVIQSLLNAQRPPCQPLKLHEQENRQLSEKVLLRDQERGWGLLENRSRLRLLTLDGFCHNIVAQSPFTSGIGQPPSPSDDANSLYEQAAERCLQILIQHHDPAAKTLLLHLDHQMSICKDLLTNMLACREQWLNLILKYSRNLDLLRQTIQSTLQQLIVEKLTQINQQIPVMVKHSLPALMQFSAAQRQLCEQANWHYWPNPDPLELQHWHAISHFLLTQSGTIRTAKGVNKTIGFPTTAIEEKRQFQQLLNDLSRDTVANTALQAIQKLPTQSLMDDSQWKILTALFEILPRAHQQLMDIFSTENSMDFTQIALAAAKSLGAMGHHPTELQQCLDYQIKHILVDEFQDTSLLQIELLQALTEGWTPDCGKSLFLVGDPMQSIYRFRKADVGLFIRAAQHELAFPEVETLRLTQNFRSCPAIVDWVNHAFSTIFPNHDDAITGAISCAKAEAPRNDLSGGVSIHWQPDWNEQAEVNAMLTIIRPALAQQRRIGVLARSRTHLTPLIHRLNHENIPYKAIDILKLNAQPEILHLQALTHALLNPGDHLAWLSLLHDRACGLDTHAIAQLMMGRELPTWRHIQIYYPRLMAEHQQRCRHFIHAMQPSVESYGKTSLINSVKTAWHRLGSPQLYDAIALENCAQFFQLLSTLEQQGIATIENLNQRLESLYAAPQNHPQSQQLELLTMHASKGLQWDTVILPSLGKKTRGADSPLIIHSEVALHDSPAWLISAKPPTRTKEPIYQFISNLEKEKNDHENARLLYVACTRAERELHLFGHLSASEKSIGEAPKGSLFATVWPADQLGFGAQVEPFDNETVTTTIHPNQPLQHIGTYPQTPQSRWSKTHIETHPEQDEASSLQENTKADYGWAGISAAPIGIALHRVLQHLGEISPHRSPPTEQHLSRLMLRILQREGLSGEKLQQALKRCHTGLNNIRQSKTAQWILSNNHDEIYNEWPLTVTTSTGFVSHMVIDRAWRDGDTFWIIDYKTASHSGGNLALFLDNEKLRHTPQLHRYGRLIQQKTLIKHVRMGLYFPMLDIWCEVEPLAKEN